MNKYVTIVFVILVAAAAVGITHAIMSRQLTKQAEIIINSGEEIVRQSAEIAGLQDVTIQKEADINAAKSRNENLDGMLKDFQSTVTVLRREVRNKNRELLGKDSEINVLKESMAAGFEGTDTVVISCPSQGKDFLELEIRTACFIGTVTTVQGKVYAHTSWRTDILDQATNQVLATAEGKDDPLEIYKADEDTKLPKGAIPNPRTQIYLDVGLSDSGFTGRLGADWRFGGIKGPAKTRVQFKLFGEAQYVASPETFGQLEAADNIRGVVGMRFSFGKRK